MSKAASNTQLSDLTDSILEGLAIGGEPDVDGVLPVKDVLARVKSNVDEVVFPRGPADGISVQEFSSFVTVADDVYSIPHVSQVNPTTWFVEKAFNETMRAFQAQESKAGLSMDAMDDFMQVVGSVPAPQRAGTAIRTLEAAGQLTSFRKEDGTVDAQALRGLADQVSKLYDVDKDHPEGSDWDPYRFDIFQPDTINLGIQLVYRQLWEPVDYQVGELLRTIPLAPGEVQKYELKTWEKAKTTEEVNSLASFSSEEVLSTTQRDVLDVLRVAKRSQRVKADGSGGVNFGVWSAKGSTGLDRKSSRESRTTKKRFREAMAKSALNLKNERKVTVTTALETGMEEVTTKEIRNPNNEITVTYLFYELQRRYRVSERLHDVRPVVYVAEWVPPAMDIDWKFLRQWDWVLAGAILDKSFVPDLVFASEEMPGLQEEREHAEKVYDKALDVVTALEATVKTATEALEGVKLQVALPATGSSSTDLTRYLAARYRYEQERRTAQAELKEGETRLKEAMNGLAEAEHNYAQRERDYQRGLIKVRRVRMHVRDNVMHYMQAIWNSEDPQQRYLRYKSILYPAITLSGGAYKIKEWRPVADVVDVTGPLGFIGNYAVYYLKASDNALVNRVGAEFLSLEGQRAVPLDPDDQPEPELHISTPTDAVYVEALPGRHPLLEQFKLQHRRLDLAKARQEVLKAQLENLRRAALLKADDFRDPEFDKTIVADLSAIGGLAGTP